jgi:hypothetical protein
MRFATYGLMDYYIFDPITKQISKTDNVGYGHWITLNGDQIRIIKKTWGIDVHVSTCFLMFDHGFGCGELPLLFETLVFGGEDDGDMERCATYEEALDMHERMCDRVFAKTLKEHIDGWSQ